MALILIRGENNSKLLSAITDMENHGNLNLLSRPKVIEANFADSLVEDILGSKLRTRSKVATAFFVREDATLSIMQIKLIHPPAHVIVVSDEYDGYSILRKKLDNAPEFTGYHSSKAKNGGKFDYKVNKKIENERINSYSYK